MHSIYSCHSLCCLSNRRLGWDGEWHQIGEEWHLPGPGALLKERRENDARVKRAAQTTTRPRGPKGNQPPPSFFWVGCFSYRGTEPSMTPCLARQRPAVVSQTGRSCGQQCWRSSQQVASGRGQQAQVKQNLQQQRAVAGHAQRGSQKMAKRAMQRSRRSQAGPRNDTSSWAHLSRTGLVFLLFGQQAWLRSASRPQLFRSRLEHLLTST